MELSPPPPEGWCFPPGGQELGSLLTVTQGMAPRSPPRGGQRAGPSVCSKSSEFPTASALHLEPQLPGKGRVDGGGTRMWDVAC